MSSINSAISLEALKVLQAIDEKGSFAAAAQALFKVPSALSYTMQKLESDLGVCIFDRKGQKAMLTPAGRILLKEGKALLLAANSLENKVKQHESGWETQIVIAKDTIIPNQPLHAVLSDFCQLGKQIEISIIDEVLGGGWDALYSQRADIAIGLTGEIVKGAYAIHEIGEVEFVFAMSPTHPLSTIDDILDAEQIREFPSIVVADSSRTLPSRSSGFFESKQTIKVANMQAKLEAQISGVGLGFLPAHLAQPYLDSSMLVAKEVGIPRPATPVYLAMPKQQIGKGRSWIYERMITQSWL